MLFEIYKARIHRDNTEVNSNANVAFLQGSTKQVGSLEKAVLPHELGLEFNHN